MQPCGIITLTTDFGLIDSYVGIMKGVMLGIAPEARLIDITHTVNPQDIYQAAYIVKTFHSYFPRGTIHMIVVDPGVGSQRRAIALSTPDAFFVAPDNGVLTYAWLDALERCGRAACEVVELAETRFWLPDRSNTFHGRDIFAPVAAHLANGTAITALGPRIENPIEATLEQPSRGRSGELVGRIIHIDYFGNCITNITPRHLEQVDPGEQMIFQIIDQRIHGLSATYADGSIGELITLIGSAGHLELAVTNGNAAQTLGAGVGDTVRVFWERQ